jgi:hypothetical protein
VGAAALEQAARMAVTTAATNVAIFLERDARRSFFID